MKLALFTSGLSKPPSIRRIKYFAILSSLGFLANLLSVNLPFVVPFLIGNVVFITLQTRLGSIWALLALIIVMLPVNEPVFWPIALAQLFFVAILPLRHKPSIYLVLCCFTPVAAVLLWLLGPVALLPNWQHFVFVMILIVMLFALNLRASQFLLALSASTTVQKKQHLQQQLSQRIALYSAIPGFLFVALILHATIALHLASKVEYYTTNQIQRDAELTSLLNRYQGMLTLAAEMLNISEPKAVLTELTQQRHEFISALTTDKNGLVTSFFKDGLEAEHLSGINVSHRYYFIYPAATGKPVITDSFQGIKLGDDQLFAISQPLISQNEFAGIIEVSVALDRLQSVLPQSKESFEQRLLIDKEGRKLWGSNEQSVTGSNIDTERQIASSRHFLLLGKLISTIDAMRFSDSYKELVIERHNHLTGWLHQDKIATTAFSMRYHGYLFLAMLLSVFMLEFIAWASSRFARSYTTSLEQLAAYAANWTADETSLAQPPKLVSSSIEFETVLNNLNTLQQSVMESHKQLSSTLALRTELNAELEKRVNARTEELKSERDRAQHLANVKTRFLANMSHEIRTPITVIRGFSEQLLQSTDITEHHEFSKLIFNNTLHLQRVIDDILDSSKIDEGKLTLLSERFNFKSFLESVWQGIEPMAGAKGLELTLHYHLEPHLLLEADPFRLRQILDNLLSNAIKFTSEGKVEINAAWCSNKLELAVIDQGIGLSEAQINQLFQAFQQADSSTSRRYGGTGLGLYISRHLATLMGMQLNVKSKPAEGSVFILEIPNDKFSLAEIEATPLTQYLEEDDSLLLEGHVLIVDDVPDIRALLVHMLKNTGISYECAENGFQALRLAAEQQFDLILMDQQMPEMDGITATEQLRKLGFSKPIIRLSADVYDNKHYQHLNSLFDATLAKPINKKELKQHMQKFLLQSRLPTSKPKKSLIAIDDDLQALKQEYVERLQLQVASLQQLFELKQYEELKIELHKIKGTSACFDLTALSDLASACEQAIKSNTMSQSLFDAFIKKIKE